MNAIPVFAGTFLRSCVNASSPPAEAPIPTIGNDGRVIWGAGGDRARFLLGDFKDFALDWPIGRPRYTLEGSAEWAYSRKMRAIAVVFRMRAKGRPVNPNWAWKHTEGERADART